MFFLAAACLPAWADPLTAIRKDPFPDDNTLWGIGNTGVMCAMPPCPWRGFFPIDDGIPTHSIRRSIPLLPRLQGKPAQVRAVEDAWRDGRCIQVKGRLEDGYLVIADLQGAC